MLVPREASLLPVEDEPLMRWQKERERQGRRGGHLRQLMTTTPPTWLTSWPRNALAPGELNSRAVARRVVERPLPQVGGARLALRIGEWASDDGRAS
ncbi:MAG: hypothetical protein R2695_04705 [Acidimicrobiales bacterium]